jgi:hypothetical protein
MQKREIRYFYEIDKTIFYITDTNDELQTKKAFQKDFFKHNYFEAGKEYETTLESLLKYRTDFNKWANTLSKFGIDYRKYYDHNNSVKNVFYSKSTKAQKQANMQDINIKEFNKIEKCSNGGLINVDLSIIEKEIQCWGYDFSSWYANLLTNFGLKIPVRQGKLKQILKYDYNNLQYGIYNVSIVSEHPNFYKIFAKSQDNYVTHFTILMCHKYQKKFDIEITPLDGDCLVWEESDLIESSDLFGEWFVFMSDIKKKFPKNKLVKRLMSSIWGSLCQFNRTFKDEKEFWDLDVSEKDDESNTEYKLIKEKYYKEGTRYEVVKTNQPYVTKFGRIKPLLTSFSRCQMAEILIENKLLGSVIRLHTDGIVLNKPFDFADCGYAYYPIVEQKTTGKIIWHNVNNYDKYCETCNKFILHTDKSVHEHF